MGYQALLWIECSYIEMLKIKFLKEKIVHIINDVFIDLEIQK